MVPCPVSSARCLPRVPFRIRLGLCALLSGALTAVAAPTPVTPPTVGSANTATADPPIPRPAVTPCVVTLLDAQPFADFSPKLFSYQPPTGCPGPWQKVVLEADYSVEAGRQFDRTATLWLGGANIYFGTTAEPSAAVARAWHVERDLSELGALLSAPQPGRAELGNLVDGTYTSTLWGSARLLFYPVSGHPDDDKPAAPVADVVLPLSAGPDGGTVALFSPTDALTATFQLPRNIERAYLEVLLQPQGANDEFWYTCVPDALAATLESCVGTAFREGEFSIDGVPAGVVPIRPWIFTGGIDPYFWRPIPGPQTLNFEPYRVDLSPFAGMLDDGQPHTFSLQVSQDSNYFQTTATLLLYLDHGRSEVHGALETNTLTAPALQVVPTLSTAADGTVSGTVATSAERAFTQSGWVETSHGRVSTTVRQSISFANQQQFVVPAALPQTFVQNITQSTIVDVRTTVHSGEGGEVRASRHEEWPLTLNLAVNLDAGGNFTSQVGSGTLAFRESARTGDRHSLTVNSVRFGDTYPTRVGQSGRQFYLAVDPAGHCYSRELTAAGGVLTAIVDGKACPEASGSGRE